jgi:hypothetical protein
MVVGVGGIQVVWMGALRVNPLRMHAIRLLLRVGCCGPSEVVHMIANP